MSTRPLVMRILQPDYAHDPDLPRTVLWLLAVVSLAVGIWTFEAFLTALFNGSTP